MLQTHYPIKRLTWEQHYWRQHVWRCRKSWSIVKRAVAERSRSWNNYRSEEKHEIILKCTFRTCLNLFPNSVLTQAYFWRGGDVKYRLNKGTRKFHHNYSLDIFSLHFRSWKLPFSFRITWSPKITSVSLYNESVVTFCFDVQSQPFSITRPCSSSAFYQWLCCLSVTCFYLQTNIVSADTRGARSAWFRVHLVPDVRLQRAEGTQWWRISVLWSFISMLASHQQVTWASQEDEDLLTDQVVES